MPCFIKLLIERPKRFKSADPSSMRKPEGNTERDRNDLFRALDVPEVAQNRHKYRVFVVAAEARVDDRKDQSPDGFLHRDIQCEVLGFLKARREPCRNMLGPDTSMMFL